MAEVLLIDCVGHATLTLNETVGGCIKFRGKFQEADSVNKNKRCYPMNVLSSNVDKLMETIEGRGLYGELDHPCITDNEFSVLTPEGWREFKEIRTGDYVFSRVDGKMTRSRVLGIVDKPYDGAAYKVKGRSIDCTFTPDHRFLMLKRQDCGENQEEIYATIKNIHDEREKYNHNVIPKTARWGGNNSTSFVIPSKREDKQDLVFDTEKFVAFLGIYLAEGNVKSNNVYVHQSNEIGRKLIRNMLSELHPDITWKENEKSFYTSCAVLKDYLAPLGNKYVKYVPEEVKNLSATYLEKLIFWFAVGDGRIMNLTESIKDSLPNHSLDMGANTRISVFSVSKQLISDMHECLVKTGNAGSISTITSEEDYLFAGRLIKASSKKPLYNLNISRSKFIHLDRRFLKVTEVQHTGRIYCLRTEHGNFYMQKNGKSFWTGNCDSIIHLANTSHIITKLWWEGNVLMGEGEVLNTPSGKVLKSLIEGGARVGISSRGVGNGQVNNEGVLVIGESYKLITFDAVADPSTFSAFQQKVIGKKIESYVPEPRVETKKINPKVLISYLGEFLNKKVNETKNKS